MACNDSKVPKKRFVQPAQNMGTKSNRQYQVSAIPGEDFGPPQSGVKRHQYLKKS